MFDMDATERPSLRDWMTRSAAARDLGVSTRTIDRMVARGVLVPGRPTGVPGEVLPVLLWAPDVFALRARYGPEA
jgi:hypothetical protein